MLREVDVPPNLPLDQLTMETLCTLQTKLESICLGPLPDLTCDEKFRPRVWLQDLVILDTPWNIRAATDLEFYDSVISECPKLRTLGLRMENILEGDESLQDTAKTDGLLCRKLFATIKATGKRPKLDELWFQDISLSAAARTFARVIDFTGLRYLHMFNCPGAEILLSHLNEQSRDVRFALRGVLYHNDITVRPISYLQEFLGSFSSLEYLQVMDRFSVDGFDTKCLSKHFATLAHLYLGRVEDADPEGLHWKASFAEIQTLSRSAVVLRQLAIALPDVRLLDAERGDRGSFGGVFVRMYVLLR